jgi:hypothetical protein
MRVSVLFNLVLVGGICLGPSPSHALEISEDFSTDPAQRGWKSLGEGNLFQWNAVSGKLDATWDSSRSNSYFALPLRTPLTTNDDFSVSFQLRLRDCAAGINPAKASTFQLAVAFINLAQATSDSFLRGTGGDSPNLMEFNYFPDPGGSWQWGASITTVLVDKTGFNWCYGDPVIDSLATGAEFHVSIAYSAANRTLSASILRDGAPFATIPDRRLGTNFLGFNLDAIAVCSFSDAGQFPEFEGSILAHGTVDNFKLTLPEPPIGTISGGFVNSLWQVEFESLTDWVYTLERTTNLQQWTAASAPTSGNNSPTTLTDTNSTSGNVFYRVRTERN